MAKIISIASGEAVATDLISKGFENVFAFNEAMCEGKTVSAIHSPAFCKLRALAYGVNENEYTHFADKLSGDLTDTNKIELFFDYDMFCAVNTITLLAYLESVNFKGNIKFNLIEQNGTANVIKSFPISLGGFNEAYNQVLIERKPAKTGIEHLDSGIELYLDYKQPDNKITQYIKNNISLSKNELCKQILNRFSEYGLGDASIFRLIDEQTDDEIWDLYTESRELTGKTHHRNVTLPDGYYHLVIQVWIRNSDGKYLISQRSASRKSMPLMWECVGGSVLKGETSLDGAIREVKEEVGIDLTPDMGKLVFSRVRKTMILNGRECKFNDILDVWIFEYNGEVDLENATTDEVAQIKWLDKGEIQELYDNKKLVETLDYFFERDEF